MPGRHGAALATLGLTLVACHNPGDPISPDPVRYLVGAKTPCRISFGPTSRVEQAATITTPDGPVRIEIGELDLHEERPPTNTVIRGIRVRLADGAATWDFPPRSTTIEAPGLDLEPMLADLIFAADVHAMVRVVLDRVDGAQVEHAGLANPPDVTVTYDDGTTSSFNGRENRGEPEGEAVAAVEFAAVVERLLGDEGCATGPRRDAVDAARAIESDVGSLLEVEPRSTTTLMIGAVELVGAVDGRFPATLTHAEARLLRDASLRSGG